MRERGPGAQGAAWGTRRALVTRERSVVAPRTTGHGCRQPTRADWPKHQQTETKWKTKPGEKSQRPGFWGCN